MKLINKEKHYEMRKGIKTLMTMEDYDFIVENVLMGTDADLKYANETSYIKGADFKLVKSAEGYYFKFVEYEGVEYKFFVKEEDKLPLMPTVERVTLYVKSYKTSEDVYEFEEDASDAKNPNFLVEQTKELFEALYNYHFINKKKESKQ